VLGRRCLSLAYAACIGSAQRWCRRRASYTSGKGARSGRRNSAYSYAKCCELQSSGQMLLPPRSHVKRNSHSSICVTLCYTLLVLARGQGQDGEGWTRGMCTAGAVFWPHPDRAVCLVEFDNFLITTNMSAHAQKSRGDQKQEAPDPRHREKP
jgi:hypothetical protein